MQVYETFYNCKPCDFIGDQCNEVGLNEGILNIFLTTGKSNTEFRLLLTNGIVNSHGKYFTICHWKYQTTKIIFHLVNMKKKFVKR